MLFTNCKNFMIKELSEEKFRHAIEVVKNNDDEKYYECDIIGEVSHYNICLDIILMQYDYGYALEFNVFNIGHKGYGVTDLGIPYDIIKGAGNIIFNYNNVSEYENMTYEEFLEKLDEILYRVITKYYFNK